jgi:hypothetical protein
MKVFKPRSMMQEHRSTHQASQHIERKQLDNKPAHFEILWKLLRQSLMKSFIKKRTCIVKGTLSL